MNIKSYIIGN